jgi:hypothetical protein
MSYALKHSAAQVQVKASTLPNHTTSTPRHSTAAVPPRDLTILLKALLPNRLTQLCPSVDAGLEMHASMQPRDPTHLYHIIDASELHWDVLGRCNAWLAPAAALE